MVNFSTYPYPTYIPNKLISSILATLVFVSFVLWIIQSIQNHFQPIRLIILLLISHIVILTELIIRATMNVIQQNSKTVYLTMTALYTIGQRTIIIANFTYLIQYSNMKSRFSRFTFLGISLSIILSDILMAPAGLLSFESNTISLSFIFRQMSTSIICLVTILFYFIWFGTKTFSNMSFETIILFIISSYNCVIIAFFLLIMSLPNYYLPINDDEKWFYFFQILPIIISLITWTMLHPRRSFKFRNRLVIEQDLNEKKRTYFF